MTECLTGPYFFTKQEWSTRKPSLPITGFQAFRNCAAVCWGIDDDPKRPSPHVFRQSDDIAIQSMVDESSATRKLCRNGLGKAHAEAAGQPQTDPLAHWAAGW